MAAAEPAPPALKPGSLRTRVVVGLFLLVVAVVDIWFGGIAFALMIVAGVALVFWEWCAMNKVPERARFAGIVVLAGCGWLAWRGDVEDALLFLAATTGALLLLQLAARRSGKRWLTTGLLYAGLPAIALIFLREEPDGLALVLWTCGLVWATDIFAYFAGRSIGGPKIWPAISPNKTWAGLLGGMAGAAVVSALVAHWRDWPQPWAAMALLGALLAILAQAGDFFESWLKRRAGVKDSGRLLPGHGGLMDRVDGLVPVACVVALFVGAL